MAILAIGASNLLPIKGFVLPEHPLPPAQFPAARRRWGTPPPPPSPGQKSAPHLAVSMIEQGLLGYNRFAWKGIKVV